MTADSSNYTYQGDELELFAHATCWHRYFQQMTAAYVRGSVLEVGAGYGSMTKALCRTDRVTHWLCLDPDAGHIAIIDQAIANQELPLFCRTRHGYAAGLAASEKFDTILYLDVLEHIDDDRAEMATIAGHLAPRGHLIVLSPAFESLRSPRDEALGHFRRYTRAALRSVMPAGLKQVCCRYVDCLGALAVFSNRVLLRQEEAGLTQLRFWDKNLIPLSRMLDPIFSGILGRSVLWIGQAKEGA